MITPRITAVNPWEVLRYLGCGPGGDTGGAAVKPSAAAARNFAAARPKAVWRFFDLKGTTLEGTNLALTGQDIQRHLTDCHQCVLMAATLGADVEQLLMHVQVSDMARALILDSCASAAVENLCDNLEADLRTQVEAEGCYPHRPVQPRLRRPAPGPPGRLLRPAGHPATDWPDRQREQPPDSPQVGDGHFGHRIFPQNHPFQRLPELQPV